MSLDLLTHLLDLPNVEVLGVLPSPPGCVVLDVRPTAFTGMCPTCSRPTADWYGHESLREVRDLSLWGHDCYLRFRPRRFRCLHCQHTFVERLAWLELDQHQTERYQRYVFSLCRKQDEHSVGYLEHLTDDEVRHIFQRQGKKHSPHGSGPSSR